VARLHRHRHQRVRRVDPARRLLPRVFRRGAARRHAPGGAGLHPEGDTVQRRAVLRLGVLGRRIPQRSARQSQSTGRFAGRNLMPKTAVFPPGAGPTLAPYSPGTSADGIVYVSGTLALDKEFNVVHVGDAAKQTEFVLDQIKAVIEAAGGTMADVTFN